jgi:perosamine synthetase
LLGARAIFSLFILACRIFGASHDRIINSSVRGFAGEGFFEKIRRQPSYPLLALLRRRLLRYKQERVADRMRLAQIAIRLMPKIERPGAEASFHTHWVFPIEHDTPDDLMRYLWSRGFDASRGTSSMYVVEPPADRSHITCPEARKTFTRSLYLPVYEGLKPRDIERLAQAVQEFVAVTK